MDNLSQINFIKMNSIANRPAGIVQENFEQSNSKQQNIHSNISQNQINHNSSIYNFDTSLVKLNNETLIKYLQNLLQMPETIEEFIEELNKNQGSAKDALGKKIQIVVQNMLNSAQLAHLLSENSKIATDKILNMITTTLKSGISDTSQLREILSVLVSISQSAGQNYSTNSLKELLLLYIPLNIQTFEKNNIEDSFEEEELKNAKNSTLSILFNTLNFSSFICSIDELDNEIYIKLSVDETFLKNEFKKIVQILLKEIKLNPQIEFQNKPKAKKAREQNFQILNSGNVSINVLLCAHLIIKTIFKIDKDCLVI